MERCQNCGELLDDHIPLCKDCFFKELLWYYRNDPNVKEDIQFKKNPDGTIEEIEIIRGLRFKEVVMKDIVKNIKEKQSRKVDVE